MIAVLGAKGFAGAAVLQALKGIDECLGIDVDNYDAHVDTRCDVLVNVNGNSKKFLAAEEPALEFDRSVRSVVRSITDFPAERYVFISSVDVYTDFAEPAATREDAPIIHALQSRYGFHKWIAEHYVKQACPDWLILRLGGMVGQNLRKGPVFDLMHHVPLRVHLDSRYQYISTPTVGAVIAQLIRDRVSREVFNVCGTGTVSLRQVRDWLGTSGNDNASLERQHYEINNAKLRGVFPVPATEKAVRDFIAAGGATV